MLDMLRDRSTRRGLTSSSEITNVHAGASTVPQSTFNLSGRFVNGISSVSTGFLRFSPVLFGI
jgi:hypothetical protein